MTDKTQRTELKSAMRSALGWLMLAGAMLAGVGCSNDPNTGYTMDPPFRKQIKTVHVPIWTRGKDVYRREIEFQITEAVQKRIQAYTPYRLASKGRADTELTGSLDEVVQRPLSINPDNGLAREMEITFIVSFKWVDIATGHILAEEPHLHVSGTYYPISPLNEDFFEGSQDVINKLAERVVEHMEIPFTK
jgi:hypothetical protein